MNELKIMQMAACKYLANKLDEVAKEQAKTDEAIARKETRPWENLVKLKHQAKAADDLLIAIAETLNEPDK